MHFRYPAYFSAAIAALLVSCTNVPSSPAPAGAGTGAGAAVTAVRDGPEQALKQGMTAEEVRHIMGEPLEINPTVPPTEKAEVWVYRRTINGPVEQVLIGTKPITYSAIGGDGLARQQTVAEEPVYKQAIHFDVQTVSLLMFDGKYLSQKQKVEKRVQY
jgi:hypothetical protein